MKIADAPYIREAEMVGEPHFDDFPIGKIEAEFIIARFYLEEAVCALIRAEGFAEGYDDKFAVIDKLVDKLDDECGSKLTLALLKLREGC